MPSTAKPKYRTFCNVNERTLTREELSLCLSRGFVAIDPGADTGLAAFGPCAELLQLTSLPHAQALAYVRNYPGLLVCEVPKVYPVQQNKVNPNDLITLALKVGGLVAVAPAYLIVEPANWKGGLAKDVTARRSLAALRDSEKPIVRALLDSASESKVHNALDALAIGFWASARIRFGPIGPLD